MSASTTGTTFPFGLTAPTLASPRTGAVLCSGNVFFVSSTEAGRADDASHGRVPQTPFATLAYALGQCTPNIGDTVFVMEGHVESITATGGLSLNCAGVRVLGLGLGDNRPRLRLTGTSNASIAVSAPDMRLEGVVIDAVQLDGIVNAMTVSADDFTLVETDLYFGDSLAQARVGIVTTTNAHRLTIARCRFWGSADAGPDAFVKLVGTPRGVRLTDSWIVGRAAQALVWNAPGNVATDLLIENCTFRALLGSAAIKLESPVTGMIRNVALAGTTLDGLYDPGACVSVNVTGADETVPDGQPVTLPAVGSGPSGGRSAYDELLGAAINADRLSSFVVPVDFTSAAWNTVAPHAIAVVTGCCRVRILPRCTASLVSSGGPTIQFGFGAETNAFILSTNPLSITQGTLWLSITPKKAAVTFTLLDQIVSDTTIGFQLFVASLTGGSMDYVIWWEPLTAGSTVTAGDGTPFA